MAEETSNERFHDLVLGHQIALLRLDRGTSRRIVEILNRTEDPLAAEIQRRLAAIARGSPVDLRSVSDRLRQLRRRVEVIRSVALSEAASLWDETLRSLVTSEVAFASAALEAVLPVVYESATPNARSLRALVTSDPLRGPGYGLRTLRRWVSRMSAEDVTRIMGEVQAGLVEGATAREIARRVVGTASLRGSDGVTQITRNAASTLTRTAIMHFSNQAKRLWYLENRDVFDREAYVATLDSRTTAVCRSLDGRIYDLGEGPYPPLHPNCRSVRVAVIAADLIGLRPFKPTTERMLLREFTGRRNLPAATSRAGLPRGTRRAFDEFARARTRELVGRVPARTTYEQWLRRQPAAVQDDILGQAKGRLFRGGNLTLDRFVDQRGREFNLRELAVRDRQAFIDAGLDPGDFGRSAA